MNVPARTLPDHVPPELARPFALTPRKTVHRNPYSDIIPELHRGPASSMALIYSRGRAAAGG